MQVVYRESPGGRVFFFFKESRARRKEGPDSSIKEKKTLLLVTPYILLRSTQKNVQLSKRKRMSIRRGMLARRNCIPSPVTTREGTETYVGLTATDFKTRWRNHRTSFKHEKR